jgi:hypothetical protein
MTTKHLHTPDPAEEFGCRVAARLAGGTDELSYEVRERLRAARTRALEARKAMAMNSAPAIVGRGASATLALGGGDDVSWGNRIASALPLLVLAAGLVLLHVVQTDQRASEIAEVDAALLTDDLPPAAYADPGFVQFLKSGGE